MSAARIGLVAYAYYPGHRQRLLQLVQRLLRDTQGSQVALVHAPGQALGARPQLDCHWIERPHDGSGWEWGAYQAGLDALRATGWAGPVAFINDTAGVHYPLPPAELQALRGAALSADGATPALSGHVQAAPPGLVLQGRPISAWVRSNAFVLSPAALRVLEQRLFERELFQAPTVRGDGTLAWPDAVSPALAAYLDAWLLSPGKHGWRRHAGRAEVPAQQLRDKAGAILLEKRLAAAVVAAGGRLQHCGPDATAPWQRLKLRAFYWRRRLAA